LLVRGVEGVEVGVQESARDLSPLSTTNICSHIFALSEPGFAALPGSRIRTGVLTSGRRPHRGDYVEIVIDAGDTSQTYTVEATRAGRRVEVTQGRSVIEVTEVTRGGTPVRTARFMAARVLALDRTSPPAA
jgi:hypothetical protein